MSNYFIMGKSVFVFFYYFESIISMLAGLVLKSMPFSVRMTFLVILVLNALFLRFSISHLHFSEEKYKYMSIVCMRAVALILGCQFNDTQVFIYAMYVNAVALMPFFDTAMYKLNTWISVFGMVLCYLGTTLYSVETFETRKYIVGAIGVGFVHWINYNVITMVLRQDKRKYEQERSLDDMLKVVEAKCDEARQATQSKSEFLSNMSHEIRTPINAVLGMNEMILRESTNDNITGYASNVANSGKMLLSLVNDILDFSKIESGKMEIVITDYEFKQVMVDLVDLMKPKAKEKGLEFRLEYDKNIPNYLRGDEVRIKQIATNLLTNAVKYTDYGTVTLRFGCTRLDDGNISLFIEVKDTGRGIKGADVRQLFDQFLRVDEKNNKNIEGTGLGLNITKSFVDMMNGTIQVDSVYGGGSTFTVNIPQTVIKDEPVGDMAREKKSDAKVFEQYHRTFIAPDVRILVVDDNEMNLKVVQGLLKETQIKIDVARGGKECLDMLANNKYHLLMLDHMMPGMNGLSTIRRIRANGFDDNMPIVALTANAVSGAKDTYLDYGFSDYLSKPITSAALESALYRLLPKSMLIKLDRRKEKLEPVSEDKSVRCIVDKAYGVELCNNDEELYKEIIDAYFEQGRQNIRALVDFYDSEDWYNYAILAHAIKSTSLNVGAREFSKVAANHESAAKNSNGEFVKASFSAFINEYRQILSEVHRLIEDMEE